MKPIARSAILLITAANFLSACATMPWFKEDVPDVPMCRPLESKVSKTIKDGKEFVLNRPNPKCSKMGEERCGFCVWTVSDRSQLVGDQWNHLLEVKSSKDGKVRKKKWSTIQAEGLLLPAESQAWSKAFAINICNKSNMCSSEIDRWRLKLDALDSVGDTFGR